MFSDENITEIFSRMVNSVLTVVEIATGEETIIPTEGDSVQGRWSPDGRWTAYWTADEGQRDIRMIRADGSDPFLSITDDPPADWAPFWSPDGTMLYFLSDRGGSPDLWRVAIDPQSGEAAGPLQSVTTGVADLLTASMAADGLRIAVGIEQRSSSIEKYAFDPATERLVGQPEVVFFSNNEVVQSDLSNDEQKLAFRSTTPHDDIITIRVDGSERRRLTNDVARDRGPSWGPNDEWLFFYSNRGGSYENFLIRSDGTGLRQLTGMPATDVNDVYVSNDGERIAVVVFDQEGSAIVDIDPSWLEADSSFEPLELETSTGHIIIGGFSPDDRYLVATTPPSGTDFTTGFLEIESNRFLAVTSPFGDRHNIWWDPAWIDERRLIFWDRELARAFIADAETGEAHEVPEIPGPSGFEVADGGRTLYLIRRIEKADIWMLTLTDGKEDTNDR
jgi:Tol biopolymer transport system component